MVSLTLIVNQIRAIYSRAMNRHHRHTKMSKSRTNKAVAWQRTEKQSGVILIIVVLAIALMATLMAVMVEDQHLFVRQVTNQRAAEQSFQLAQGMNAWAARVLRDDENPTVDYQGEDWYLFGRPELLEEDESDGSFSLDPSNADEEEEPPSIDFGVEGVSGTIDDLQGRYNLNNLANPDRQFVTAQRRILQNLFELLEVGDFAVREQLVENLIDWVDENDTSRSIGLESTDYQALDLPYQAADQKLTSLGELRFIDGFTDEIIRAITPHVTVLPVDNARININTTTTEVLASLSSTPIADTTSVDSFLARRLDDAFLGFQAAQIRQAEDAIIGVSAVPQPPIANMLQVTSQYFQLTSRIELGEFEYCMNSLVLRAGRAVQANAAAQTQNAAVGGQNNNQQSASSQAEALSDVPPISVLNREYSSFCEEPSEQPLGLESDETIP